MNDDVAVSNDQTSQMVLHCDSVTKSFATGPEKISVLKQLELSVKAGERLAIMGSSGAGKSTLLNIIGGLSDPDSGTVTVGGQVISGLSENKRAKLRNQCLGFVYQFHHLLAEFSALENVAMPLRLRGESSSLSLKKAREMLDAVGLAQRGKHRPAELSGGERQRTAIARALVTSPLCVLMDEPTGNLDQANAQRVMDLLAELNTIQNTAIVLVTHDTNIAAAMDRQLILSDGQLVVAEGLA